MPSDPLLDVDLLRRLADQVGTPFFFYDAAVLRSRIALVREVVNGNGLAARYAMKACSSHLVLREIDRDRRRRNLGG